MLKNSLGKIKESFFVVLPISLLIFLVITFFVPSTSLEKINLAVCFVILVFGMMFFTNGAEMSMVGIGESVGGGLCRTKKLWLMLFASFLIGFITTFAEPDLQVFAGQVASSFLGISSQWAVIITVSLGVAVFFVLAFIKTIFKLSLPVILVISYAIVIILSFFLPKNFIGMCFDSGSVTTGPISVPFIMAFGLGVASVRWRNKSDDDSFGLVGLCSVGPIIAVMIMCLFVKNPDTIITDSVQTTGYLNFFVKYLKEIFIVILPILLIFIIFQFTMIKFPKKQIKKTILGIFFTYIGIVLFLVGVNVGYLPLATKIGEYVASSKHSFWLYPLGALLCFCCVIAEPALQVLKNQVKEITHGMIKPFSIVIVVAIGVSISGVIAILKTIHDFNVLFVLVPILATSLILGFINTKLFTGLSFDAGGVATGAMSVSFILPFVNGIALAVGTGTGFGTIALIATMPILTVQILGLIFKIKLLKTKKQKEVKSKDFEIINFDWEEE